MQARRAPKAKENRLWAWGGWTPRGEYRGRADGPEYDGRSIHKKRKWDDIGEIKQLSLTSISEIILECDSGQTIYNYLANNTLIRNDPCMSRRNIIKPDWFHSRLSSSWGCCWCDIGWLERDFSNTVPHNILTDKAGKHGLDDSTVRWM